MQLRTILVGVGGRGRWPVEVLGADARFEVVGVVDFNAEFASRAARDLNLDESSIFQSLETAFQTLECEAIVICTPTQTHAKLARMAFGAGKHVLVEKGMTMDWDEAQALVREADAAGVKFCVAQNYRYKSTESAISRLLGDQNDAHYPGAIATVDWIHHRYRPSPRTLNYPFATVWDMSCHHFDCMVAWLGSPRRVTAHASNPPWSAYEHPADIAAFIEFDSGAVCHYVLTHAATLSHQRLILQGERGALRAFDVAGVEFYPLPDRQLGESAPQSCAIEALPPSEQGVADAFLGFIRGGIEPGISGRQNLQTLLLCELTVRSASLGRAMGRDEVWS